MLKYGVLNYKPTSALVETTIKLHAEEGKDQEDPSMYR